MKIKPPKPLGKLRYMECSDIAPEMARKRSALWFYLPLLLFCATLSGLLIAGCFLYHRDWSDWLVAAFMTVGTIIGLNSTLPALTRVRMGMVCDRGVGYGWFRQDGSLARATWYAFQPETQLKESIGRDGWVWAMKDKYSITFFEGRRKCFVASYLVGYDDNTSLEFVRQASKAFLLWRKRLGLHQDALPS